MPSVLSQISKLFRASTTHERITSNAKRFPYGEKGITQKNRAIVVIKRLLCEQLAMCQQKKHKVEQHNRLYSQIQRCSTVQDVLLVRGNITQLLCESIGEKAAFAQVERSQTLVEQLLNEQSRHRL
jgi:hypothetical protein